MAIKIEETNMEASQFVPSTSRYANSDVVYWGDQKRITYKTYKKKKIRKSEDDRYAVIPPGYEYRPDMISFDAYGTPDFWWVIMEANGISDIFDFKTGLNIILPSNVYF